MSELSEVLDPESAENGYQKLLGRYHNMRHNMEGSPGMFRDPKGANEKLHRLHLRLLKTGGAIGKNRHEVLTDFLLLDRNLSEYGLPEIGVRELPPTFLGDVVCDLVMENGESPKEKPYFRIDILLKNNEKIPKVYDDHPLYKSWLDKPHVFLIYYGYWGGTQWNPDITPAFSKKEKALEKASKDFGLRVFKIGQVSMVPDMHLPADLYGLEVPAEKLEEIALKIRADRDKYWITDKEEQNPFSKAVLVSENKERLWDYFSYLEHNQLELEKGSWGGIPEKRKKTIQGWYDLLNVVEALKKHGNEPEEVFGRSQEILTNLGSQYIPDEILKDVDMLSSEGKLNEAERLQKRLDDLMNR